MSLLVRKRPKPVINIVPLMDVLTILIFFFLVSTQFKEINTLNLTLPEVRSAGQNELPNRITISIDAEGQVYLENQPIQLEELDGLLGELAAVSTEVPVLLRLDDQTYVQKMVEVMDACRLNGFNRITMQSR